MAKTRVVYTLSDKSKDLLGIIWFSKKNGITFGIRTYPPARGKGHSIKFMQKALKDFLKSEDYAKLGGGAIWLETHIDNTAAIGLYRKMGWKESRSKSGKKVFTYPTVLLRSRLRRL